MSNPTPSSYLFLSPRPICAEGIRLIKDFEGLHLTPYLCPAGVWTIGYGHTRTVREGMRLSQAQAEQLLNDDIDIFSRGITQLVTVSLNDYQFSSLVCFAFNIGLSHLHTSTLLRLLNRGWYEQVPIQMMRWNKAKGEELGGLTRRRKAEAALWNKTLGLSSSEQFIKDHHAV